MIGQSEIPKLKPRKLQILRLICQGFEAKEIGQMLGISVRTVEVHKRELFDKFRVRNQFHLAAMAIQMQCITDKIEPFDRDGERMR